MERGPILLQAIAETIVARWLRDTGSDNVARTRGGDSGRGVDITCTDSGVSRKIKVKADPYCGTDSAKVSDRSLAFYRAATDNLALEAIADSSTREPGWALGCDADEVCYYYLAIAQPEEELARLLALGEDALLGGLRVERDELLVLPMEQTAAWFAKNVDRYPPRPVVTGSRSGWYRLVPRSDVEAGVSGARVIGSIFSTA